jgi:uncharacterized tellurite resistance protein B-like protein
MHILLGLIAVIVGIAVWWWRIRMMSEAAGQITDVAGRAWGKYKRNKFKGKVEASPIEAVEDPAAAAVIMMIAVAQVGRPLSPKAEATIEQIASSEMRLGDVTELMTFAKWVASHVIEPNDLSRRYARLWTGALNVDERHDFLAMVRRVAQVDGDLNAEKQSILSKLHERLGLASGS